LLNKGCCIIDKINALGFLYTKNALHKYPDTLNKKRLIMISDTASFKFEKLFLVIWTWFADRKYVQVIRFGCF